tara:strand:+ start:437 stop:601 length:165 start_codon:yes stop_codon:yes gene_type:complete
MKLEDFKGALVEAGWGAISDAQHYGIEDLHKELFPLIAELEKENFELYCQISDD